jgi:hypothetical protein
MGDITAELRMLDTFTSVSGECRRSTIHGKHFGRFFFFGQSP